MVHPQRHRVAAVLSATQGSGYLLTPWLVLTAAHVVSDTSQPIRAVVPGGTGPQQCIVEWSRYDEECDAAVLVAAEALIPPESYRDFETLLWGRVTDLVPRPGAHAIGYPAAQRSTNNELAGEQLFGTLKPGSGLLRHRHTLDSLHGAPTAPQNGSPWAGYSGAAVFLNDNLVGIARADPDNWQHGRLELTPATAILSSERFSATCSSRNYLPAWIDLQTPSGNDFEERLRGYIIKQSSTVHIIGLSRGGEEEEFWPLDASYLSLELTGSGRSPDADEQGHSPERAEQALAGQPRVLIRGTAGSGKTTLLQWLATAVARRDLPPPLSELKDCVPLLIRLRAVAQRQELPGPEEFLAIVAKPLAGSPGAAGWVTAQLAAGRILLLIDGVDEVPEADRARTRRWLLDLLDAYPDCRFVVTTRPSAVREGWLAGAGFTELELLPMSRVDVSAFISKWHSAAGSDPRLPVWRDRLRSAVISKQDLGRLATTPLMCALICALNRDRNGYLPEGRMELYAAALEMLLVRRDRERGIAVDQGLRLTVDQQTQLLQRLAYWLARNGAVEIERDLAVRKLEDVLPAMPAITADAEQVLHHLLVRSGLLRQPTAETVDFVHRTFQDYLAAKAAIEDEDFGLLLAHAHDEQWHEVIRMAVGHGRPRERAKLLRSLLAQADQLGQDRLRLLAATCLEHATELDPAVRDQITDAVNGLIPPHSKEDAKLLAEAGPLVLGLLPGPEGLDEDTATAVVVAATAVATSQALPLLAQYADHPSISVRGQLAYSWDRFDTREYGEEVVSHLDYQNNTLRFIAKSRAHLEFLAEIGGRPRVECSGPLTMDDLMLLTDLDQLRIHANDQDLDLGPVLESSRPRNLWLTGCTSHLDLAPLPAADLEDLYLHSNLYLHNADALAHCSTVRILAISGTSAIPDLAFPPGLTHLYLGDYEAPDPSLDSLDALEFLYLRAAHLTAPAFSSRPLESRFPSLRRLRLTGLNLSQLGEQPPAPGITELELVLPSGLDWLHRLPGHYPSLQRLLIALAYPLPTEARVQTALAALPGCEVELHQHAPDVQLSIFGVGAAHSPIHVSRLTVQESRG